MFGITIAVARENGYTGSMKAMPLSVAKSIYKKKYWDTLELDKLTNQKIANIAFDIAVNAGVGTASKMLQETVNFMTYDNILVDGDIGKTSVARLNTIDTPKETELAVLLISTLQGEHYLKCMRNREKNEEFALGWLRRMRKNMNQAN
jgi:lysozyme family protein